MNRSELSKALLAGALVMAASSSAHARPSVSAFEPRELVTFDEASAGSGPAFDLSSTSTSDRGKKVFGDYPHRTSPFGWNPDSNVKLDHGVLGQGRGHNVVPVSAIPEPSTYALLAAGLAGIALITRRRRQRGR